MSVNRYYSSSALPTVLASAITTATATTFFIGATPASLGWPGSYPFTVLLDWGSTNAPGSANAAESVLVTSISGTTVTCVRGIDGTTPCTHAVQAYNNVYHGTGGQDVAEPQVHMQASGPTVYQPSGGVSVQAPMGTASSAGAFVSIPLDSVPVHGIQSGSAVVGTTDTQTLTNKTLTSPVLNTGTFSGQLVSAVTKSSGYTLTATDSLVLVTGTTTITLPTAVGVGGTVYTIVNIDASLTTTVNTTSSQTINGALTVSMPVQFEYIQVISNGANWFIIDSNLFGNVTAQTSYGAASSNGTALTFSHSDHAHGTPSLNSTAGNITLTPGVQAAGAVGTAADAGHVHPFNTKSLTSPINTVSTTETVILALPITTANLAVGSVFRLTVYGVYVNGAASATNTWTIRAGTAGTTADTSLGTIATTSNGSIVTSRNIKSEIQIVITATGSAGTATASEAHYQSAASYDTNAVAPGSASTALTAWNTTTSTFLTLTWKSSNASNTYTFNNATLEQIK